MSASILFQHTVRAVLQFNWEAWGWRLKLRRGLHFQSIPHTGINTEMLRPCRNCEDSSRTLIPAAFDCLLWICHSGPKEMGTMRITVTPPPPARWPSLTHPTANYLYTVFALNHADSTSLGFFPLIGPGSPGTPGVHALQQPIKKIKTTKSPFVFIIYWQ